MNYLSIVQFLQNLAKRHRRADSTWLTRVGHALRGGKASTFLRFGAAGGA